MPPQPMSRATPPSALRAPHVKRRLFPLTIRVLLWLWVVFGGMLVWLSPMPIAEAAPLTCRMYYGQNVCIDRIKRSAKHYWEYRVKLSIDGKQQPEDFIDCRYNQRIDRDGFIEPFTPKDVGHLVCQYFNNRTWR